MLLYVANVGVSSAIWWNFICRQFSKGRFICTAVCNWLDRTEIHDLRWMVLCIVGIYFM